MAVHRATTQLYVVRDVLVVLAMGLVLIPLLHTRPRSTQKQTGTQKKKVCAVSRFGVQSEPNKNTHTQARISAGPGNLTHSKPKFLLDQET